MKYLNHVLFAGIVIAGLFTGYKIAVGKPAKTVSDTRMGSIVRLVRDGRTFCTGVVISDSHVLTASHCVVVETPFGRSLTPDPIEIRDSSNVPTGVMAVPYSTRIQMDQAVLIGNFSNFKSRKTLTGVKELNSLTDTPLQLTACGYPLGGELYCSSMHFKELYAFMWATNGLLLPGMSGGPVFTTDGVVVALNVAVEHTDGEHQISLISPLYGIELMLRK